MDKHYRNGIHKIKKIAESIKRRSQIYSELAKMDDMGTARSLGAVQRAPAPGKKIQKVGWIIFWFPEPTGITHAIGAPMILGGKYLDKVYNSATISDIGHETKNTLGTISNFKETIN